MVSVYEEAAQSICGVDEHRMIVEALRSRDAARAVEVSRHHFLHVEERLRFEGEAVAAPDLAAVFAQYRVRPRGRKAG
jgi:DNA-binding GntR family transcriptional regulator